MLFPERFSRSITFSSFSKFLFGFLALSPSYFYQVFRCLKFCCSIFKDRAPTPSRKLPPFRGELYYSTISSPRCQAFFKSFFDYFALSAKETDFRSKRGAFCNKRTETRSVLPRKNRNAPPVSRRDARQMERRSGISRST